MNQGSPQDESEEKGDIQRSAGGEAQLVKTAEGDWKGAILLAYYTGARLNDVANTRWNAVDLKRELVTFTASKTQKPLTVRCIPILKRICCDRPASARRFCSRPWRAEARAASMA